MSTRVFEFTDAHSFLERARTFLFSDEIRHNLLLSSVLTLSKTFTRTPSLVFLATDQGAALRAPNKRWIISAETAGAAGLLTERISRDPFRSVFMPSEHRQLVNGIATEQNFMTLKKLQPLEPSAGLLRTAQPKDFKQLTLWSQKFAVEQTLDESPSEAAESIQKYLDHRQLFVWENSASQITAMAAVGGFTPKSARVSMVYTDPKFRGNGFASTLVHRLSHRLLQDGKTPVLFADAANAQTKHVYEKLGYRTLAQFTELRTGVPARESKSQDNDRMPADASR
jgi:ribosomal protein S18 acetylase RimI-like enzyme